MSCKTSRLGINSGQSKEKRLGIEVISVEKAQMESRQSRRAFVVLGLMILTISSFGAVASWRSVPTTSKALALTTGTPPVMPVAAPAKEFVYAGSALLATSESFREPPDDIAVW